MDPSQLRNIPPAKLRIILDLIEASQGKGSDSILPLFMQINQKMQQQGLQFTKEESQLILELLRSDMSPEEARKLDMIQSILESWNR